MCERERKSKRGEKIEKESLRECVKIVKLLEIDRERGN